MEVLHFLLLCSVVVVVPTFGQISVNPGACIKYTGPSLTTTYQHSEDPRRCVAGSGVTAFSGCHAWDSLVTSCANYASSSEVTSYYNCYCQQAYLDALYDCNNEERLCLGSTAIDSDFQNDYNCWHSVCDPIINYTPTSPQYSSITAPYDLNYCLTAQAACTQMSASRSQCALEYNSGDPTTSVSSCLCAPPVLSLEYTCSFLQNISCAQVPAHLSQMAGWTFCENLPDVLTVPASVTASLGNATTTRWTYYTSSTTPPATTPAIPGSNSLSSPAQTATPTSAASSARGRTANPEADIILRSLAHLVSGVTALLITTL